MNTSFNKQEMALVVFNDNVKNNLISTFKKDHNIDIIFKPLNYGMGIETIGSNNFTLIKNNLCKFTGLPIETFFVLKEDEENNSGFYAYMPEKDKSLQKKFKKPNILRYNKNY